MAIVGWKNPSTRPAERTTFAEDPGMSKDVRRYGVDGSKGDFPHGSTGGHEAHESPVAPSMPATHRGGPAVPHVETVGHAPDGSGNFHHATHPNAERQLHGNAHFTHEPLRPVGQAHSASGGAHGKPTIRPAAQKPAGTTHADHGALAGDSGPRPSYSGGKGPIGGAKRS